MTTCLEQPWTAWSLESLSPCTGTLYCLFIWKRCHGRKCVRGRNAAARTLLSHPTPAHPTPPPASGDDAMLSVAASVSEEGKQLPGRDYPTPPHPTPPHLETMPCWVWPQVCQRKERSCQDVIIPPHPTPPHLETMPCWVWPQVCQRKERSCQDVIIPHPTASGDDSMLSVATSVSEEGTQLPGRYYPTPPHPPPASGDDAMLTVAAIVTRMLVSESCGWWLVNGLFLVAKSSCFGCGIAFFRLRNRLFWLRNRLFLVAESVLFWLRKRLFLVAEACLILVAESSKFGCGSVEIWFRNRTLSR